MLDIRKEELLRHKMNIYTQAYALRKLNKLMEV